MTPEEFDREVDMLMHGKRGPFVTGELEKMDIEWTAQRIVDAGAKERAKREVISPERESASDMVTAYCVKDKKKVEMVDPKEITMKNGKKARQGTCPTCGGKLFRIGA